MLQLTLSHLNAEIFPDQGKECRCEIDFPVNINGHVHPDKFLISESIWTLITESQWGIHILEHVVHLRIVNFASGIRIVLGPYPDKLVEMMSSQDRGIPSEVVEVIHNDGDEQIQHEE